MFIVFSKQKIVSYIVAFSTVAILLGVANFFGSKEEVGSIQTSTNTITECNVYYEMHIEE